MLADTSLMSVIVSQIPPIAATASAVAVRMSAT
jgi:hypothetical protein